MSDKNILVKLDLPHSEFYSVDYDAVKRAAKGIMKEHKDGKSKAHTVRHELQLSCRCCEIADLRGSTVPSLLAKVDGIKNRNVKTFTVDPNFPRDDVTVTKLVVAGREAICDVQDGATTSVLPSVGTDHAIYVRALMEADVDRVLVILSKKQKEILSEQDSTFITYESELVGATPEAPDTMPTPMDTFTPSFPSSSEFVNVSSNDSQLLGEGTSSWVFKSSDPSSSSWSSRSSSKKSSSIAIKSFKNPSIQDSGEAEYKIQSSFENDNIVRLLRYVRGEVNQPAQIHMELCQYDLGVYLRNPPPSDRPSLDITLIRGCLKDCLQGLAFLHGQKPKKVLHRDIKPQNIMLGGQGEVQPPCWKLSDFGSFKTTAGTMTSGDPVGTPSYMAPETTRASINTQATFSAGSDIWSLGCSIMAVVTGSAPWDHKDYYPELCDDSNHTGATSLNIQAGTILDHLKNLKGNNALMAVLQNHKGFKKLGCVPLQELLEVMLKFNPRERTSAKKLLNHHFFKPGIESPTWKMELPEELRAAFEQGLHASAAQADQQPPALIEICQSVVNDPENWRLLDETADRTLTWTENDNVAELFCQVRTKRREELARCNLVDGRYRIEWHQRASTDSIHEGADLDDATLVVAIVTKSSEWADQTRWLRAQCEMLQNGTLPPAERNACHVPQLLYCRRNVQDPDVIPGSKVTPHDIFIFDSVPKVTAADLTEKVMRQGYKKSKNLESLVTRILFASLRGLSELHQDSGVDDGYECDLSPQRIRLTPGDHSTLSLVKILPFRAPTSNNGGDQGPTNDDGTPNPQNTDTDGGDAVTLDHDSGSAHGRNLRRLAISVVEMLQLNIDFGEEVVVGNQSRAQWDLTKVLRAMYSQGHGPLTISASDMCTFKCPCLDKPMEKCTLTCFTSLRREEAPMRYGIAELIHKRRPVGGPKQPLTIAFVEGPSDVHLVEAGLHLLFGPRDGHWSHVETIQWSSRHGPTQGEDLKPLLNAGISGLGGIRAVLLEDCDLSIFPSGTGERPGCVAASKQPGKATAHYYRHCLRFGRALENYLMPTVAPFAMLSRARGRDATALVAAAPDGSNSAETELSKTITRCFRFCLEGAAKISTQICWGGGTEKFSPWKDKEGSIDFAIELVIRIQTRLKTAPQGFADAIKQAKAKAEETTQRDAEEAMVEEERKKKTVVEAVAARAMGDNEEPPDPETGFQTQKARKNRKETQAPSLWNLISLCDADPRFQREHAAILAQLLFQCTVRLGHLTEVARNDQLTTDLIPLALCTKRETLAFFLFIAQECYVDLMFNPTPATETPFSPLGELFSCSAEGCTCSELVLLNVEPKCFLEKEKTKKEETVAAVETADATVDTKKNTNKKQQKNKKETNKKETDPIRVNCATCGHPAVDHDKSFRKHLSTWVTHHSSANDNPGSSSSSSSRDNFLTALCVSAGLLWNSHSYCADMRGETCLGNKWYRPQITECHVDHLHWLAEHQHQQQQPSSAPVAGGETTTAAMTDAIFLANEIRVLNQHYPEFAKTVKSADVPETVNVALCKLRSQQRAELVRFFEELKKE